MIRRLTIDRAGVTMLEFALLLPIFVLLVAGVAELGRVMWAQNALQHGVQMAARCMTISLGSCDTSSDTQSYAAKETFGLNPPASTFTVSTPACGNMVSASYKFTFVAPVIANFFGGKLVLTASSCFPS